MNSAKTCVWFVVDSLYRAALARFYCHACVFIIATERAEFKGT